jgi:hypothetical protein
LSRRKPRAGVQPSLAMGFFGNKKKLEQPLQQPLYSSPQPFQTSSSFKQPSSVRGSTLSRSASASDLALDWSKIYVEIDNDANGINPSKTQRSVEDTTAGSYDETHGQTLTNFSSSSTATATATATTGLTPTFTNLNSVGSCTNATSADLTRNQSSAIQDMRHRDDDDDRSSSPSHTDDDDANTQVTGRELNTEASRAPSLRSNLTSKEDEEEEDEDTQANFTITNNGRYLTTNDFANAQLMRWKFAAEEGPTYIQILAFLASLGGLTTTLYPIVSDEAYWSVPVGICAAHTTVLCCIILIFEFRALGARNPMNVRARARTLLTRYLNILRLLWGRGCLYIFAGTLNITIWFMPYSLYTGLALIGMGVFAILVGAHASFNLERLKMSLTDHSFLWSKFEAADSDNDNLIDISEFSNLIWSLGLELDDAYTFRAFSQIDNDSDARINFREFKNWWIAVQDDDKTTSKKLPNQIEV